MGLVGPKIENVLPTAARSKFLKRQGSRDGVRNGSKGANRTICWAHFGHFGVIWESVWVSVGDFWSVDGDFAMIVGSLWVSEGPFSKTLIFSTDFNDFIKLWC